MRACLLRPSPSCSSSIRGPRTRWNGKARQNVAKPMRRSLGLVDNEIGGRFTEATFWREEREGGQLSWIWKEMQTIGTAVGNGEGGEGDEEGEAVGDAVGVGVAESPSVWSVSSLGSKGVRGGTSSTSTSE